MNLIEKFIKLDRDSVLLVNLSRLLLKFTELMKNNIFSIFARGRSWQVFFWRKNPKRSQSGKRKQKNMMAASRAAKSLTFLS